MTSPKKLGALNIHYIVLRSQKCQNCWVCLCNEFLLLTDWAIREIRRTREVSVSLMLLGRSSSDQGTWGVKLSFLQISWLSVTAKCVTGLMNHWEELRTLRVLEATALLLARTWKLKSPVCGRKMCLLTTRSSWCRTSALLLCGYGDWDGEEGAEWRKDACTRSGVSFGLQWRDAGFVGWDRMESCGF